MLTWSVTSLSTTSCSSKPKVETCARDFCLLGSRISASPQDKLRLKQSTISKEYLRQIADHNDLYAIICYLNTENKPTEKASPVLTPDTTVKSVLVQEVTTTPVN